MGIAMSEQATRGARLLKRYMKNHQLSTRRLAALWGLSHMAVHYLSTGKLVANRWRALRIAVETNGEIPADAWLSTRERRLARRLQNAR